MAESNKQQSIAFTAKLIVNNVGYLLEEYAHHFDRVVPVPVALLHFSTQLSDKPENIGIRVTSKKLQKQSDTEYKLTVEATIKDRELFRQAAMDAIYENWGSAENFVDAADSLLLSELVLSSNASASPDHLGYTIVEVSDAQPSAPENSKYPEMQP